MNRHANSFPLWGLLLLLLGVAGLLYNFGVLDAYRMTIAYVVAGLLGAGGAGFLAAIAFQQERWEYAIPGFSLLALGGIVYLVTLDRVAPQWLGLLFLSGVALGFLALFLSDRRQRWWALLQAGTILTIGIVGLLLVNALVGPALDAPEPLAVAVPGAAMFGGFAISFMALYLFVGERKRFQWSLVMAGVLGAFAMVLLVEGLGGRQNLIVNLWPALLILVGAFLLVRVFAARPAPAQPAAPTVSAEDLEALRVDAPSRQADPARIVRPGTGDPPVAPTADKGSGSLPEDLARLDVNDPGAALDALLEASKPSGSDS